MKITFVVNSFSRQPTGGLKIIYQYANHFVERGHTVTIVFVFQILLQSLKEKCRMVFAIWHREKSYGMVQRGIRWTNG